MKSRHSLILLAMGLGLTLTLILLWTLEDGSALAAAAPVLASVPGTDGALKPPWAGMARGAVEGPPVFPNAPADDLHVCDTCIYTTIQAAVDVAQSEDVIKVATGVYTGVSARYGMTQVVYIDKAVAIHGGYTTSDWDHADPEANPVTLNAEGRGRVLYATVDVSITLEGLRFTGGDAAQGGGDHHGGGMYVEYASGTITGCQIYNNTAEKGGGVYLAYSRVTLDGNTITTNTAAAADVYDGGGGVYLYQSPATLDGNTIVSNTTSGRGGGLHLHRSGAALGGNTFIGNVASDFGGGVYLYDSDAAALNGNRVMSNTADQSGGGLYLHGSDATLSGNTVVSNTAGDGGGLFLGYSNATLVNNVVADNVADSAGGGIYVYSDSKPRLLHTTIVRNMGGDGSGVYVSHLGSSYSTVVLVNTILVSHTVGITVAAGDSAILTATLWHGNTTADWGGDGGILTGTLADNHWDDPAFVDPANGDYHITADSAARDTGVDADVDTDIDGEPRPQGPGYDIGADEHWSCIPMTSVEITGKFTTTTGVGTVFTAAVHPPTVILPITYTWEATGQLSLTQAGGISHTAVFTWYGAGTQVVTVTAVNECGSVVSKTHVITIEDIPCNALTDLGIDGPPTATVDVPTVFTATVTPFDAALTVTYTWEATGQLSLTQAGGISHTAVFTWYGAGTQVVTVTAVNECGSVVSKTHVITVEDIPCNALTDLGIDGPPTATVDVPTDFTATVTPPDAALPVTYTWRATGQNSVTHSGGVRDTATFTWSVSGPQVVTATAVNECGVEASETHAITVEAAPCIGLTDAGISGPREGYTDTLYAFTAVITPSDGSEPITYTWTPEPDRGQETDEVTYSWATTGNKTVSVEVENCGGSASDDHTVSIRGLSDEFVHLSLVLRNQ